LVLLGVNQTWRRALGFGQPEPRARLMNPLGARNPARKTNRAGKDVAGASGPLG
jgi:hypothetical protein